MTSDDDGRLVSARRRRGNAQPTTGARMKHSLGLATVVLVTRAGMKSLPLMTAVLAISVVANAAESLDLASPSTTAEARLQLSRVTEPPELKGAPFRPAVKPSDTARQFVNSKTIKAANPEHPETIAPALREINDLLKQDSTLSDLYLLRASLSCFVDAPPATIIDDIQHATALHNPATSAFKT